MTFLHYLSILGIATAALSAPHTHPKRVSRADIPSDCLTVGGSGTYSTIADAIAALGSSTSEACISIAAGTYEEQLTFEYGGPLTLYGETTDSSSYDGNTVTITHTMTSTEAGNLVASATVNVAMDDFAMYNINVVNGYGAGTQAVAYVPFLHLTLLVTCRIANYWSLKTGSYWRTPGLLRLPVHRVPRHALRTRGYPVLF